MKKIGLLLTFWLNLSASTIRSNVVIYGTTMYPNFKKLEGLLAQVCPLSHPYSFDKGTKCCAYFEASGVIKDLTFEDPEELCLHSSWITCPDLVRKCVSHHIELDTCPMDHPINLQGTCCGNLIARFDPETSMECLGQLITENTPVMCCPKESQFSIQMCQEKKMKCQSHEAMSAMVTPSAITTQDFHPYDNAHSSQEALIDYVCDIRVGPKSNFWLGRNGYAAGFEIDLGYHRLVKQIRLRNTNNRGYDDRSTLDFDVRLSNTTGPNDWTLALSSTLPLGVDYLVCKVPLTKRDITPTWARFARFKAATWYGKSSGLHYIGFF